jgi:hypothetical protein
MKNVISFFSIALIILLLVVLSVEASSIYYDATLSIGDLMTILLIGPIIAVIEGLRKKMKKG